MYPLATYQDARGCSRGGDLRCVGSQQAKANTGGGPDDGLELGDAHLVHAARDTHDDALVFGYRFIADELPSRASQPVRTGSSAPPVS